jgi:tripartite-type tricarboxylate transporter receptor subunit TctC
MRALLSVIVLVVAALLDAGAAAAQVYPTRPITMVVPFPPGGSTDVLGRILAERMKLALGQSVIIENVGGAAGVLGVGRVARAAPDGYTIDIGQWDTHVANGALYALNYDLLRDFEPITLLSANPYLLLGRKNMPADDLRGLIAWLKANPDQATQGIPTAGSQVAGVYLQKETGTKLRFVPYRGAAPAVQDLIAAQIDLLFILPAAAVPQVRSGAVKAYAVTAAKRLAIAPEIPAADEAGLPGLHLSVWFGLFAPKNTPRTVIARLNTAAAEALTDAGVRNRFTELGQEIFPPDQQTPEALAALNRAEIEKWWPIIKAANIRGE